MRWRTGKRPKCWSRGDEATGLPLWCERRHDGAREFALSGISADNKQSRLTKVYMYAKIFTSLYQGTLRGNSHCILVFTNLLAHADRDGIVDIHPRAIAEEVGLTREQVQAAIDELEAPDPESRSPDEQGRRITRVDAHRAWGWLVVNYAKYRAIRSEDDRREQNREAQARWRAKQADNKPSKPSISNVSRASAGSAQGDGEGEGEVDTNTGARGGFFVAHEAEKPPPPDQSEDQPPQPTAAGRACLACRGANVHDVNPSHPDLLRLLAAGVTPEEIGATAAECSAKGKPRFAYVLATVERRRSEAAQAPQIADARPVTVPMGANPADGFHAMMDERAATATKPTAAFLSLANRTRR